MGVIGMIKFGTRVEDDRLEGTIGTAKVLALSKHLFSPVRSSDWYVSRGHTWDRAK